MTPLDPMIDDDADEDGPPLVFVRQMPEGYRLVPLGSLPLDGTYEVLSDGCGGELAGVRLTPSHHLAGAAVDSTVMVLARPIDLARLIDTLDNWAAALAAATKERSGVTVVDGAAAGICASAAERLRALLPWLDGTLPT